MKLMLTYRPENVKLSGRPLVDLIKEAGANGDVNLDKVAEIVTEDIFSGMDPVVVGKYATMLFTPEPEETLKAASVDHKAATNYSLMVLDKLYGRVKTAGYPEKRPILDEEIPEHTRKYANAIKEFEGADKDKLKFMDRLLGETFPALYKNAEARMSFLAFTCIPETMKKTSAYYQAPSAVSRYGLPLAAGVLLGMGAKQLEMPHTTNKIFTNVVERDPQLIEFDKGKVLDAINDLNSMAPDIMKNPTVAASFIRQMVTLPPGGLSVDFAEKLIKAQKNKNPGTIERASKVIDPATKMLVPLLGLF